MLAVRDPRDKPGVSPSELTQIPAAAKDFRYGFHSLFEQRMIHCIWEMNLQRELRVMTKFGSIFLAAVVGISSSLPAAAQQAFERVGSETALEMATRIGACADGSGISSAEFVGGGSELRVVCLGGAGGELSGGLSTAAAVAGGVIVIAVIAAAASGGGSSSTTGTN